MVDAVVSNWQADVWNPDIKNKWMIYAAEDRGKSLYADNMRVYKGG